MPGDVREPEQVEGFLDVVGERLGPVDVLVNNAGGNRCRRWSRSG